MGINLESKIGECCYMDEKGKCTTRADYVLVHKYKRKAILRVCVHHVEVVKKEDVKVLGAGLFPMRMDMYRGV